MVELSETFFCLLVTTSIGFLLTVLKFCYKSKCSKVDVCCIKIERTVEIEVKEDIENNKNKEENNE